MVNKQLLPKERVGGEKKPRPLSDADLERQSFKLLRLTYSLHSGGEGGGKQKETFQKKPLTPTLTCPRQAEQRKEAVHLSSANGRLFG